MPSISCWGPKLAGLQGCLRFTPEMGMENTDMMGKNAWLDSEMETSALKKTFRWFCNIKEIGKSNHGLPRKHLLRISIPKHPTEFLLNSDWTNISHSQRGSSRARVTALSSLFLVLRHIYTRITRGAHLEKSCTWNVTCKKTMPLIWVNYNMSLTSCGHLEMISLYCARALSLRGGYAQPRQSKREISACPELHNRIH